MVAKARGRQSSIVSEGEGMFSIRGQAHLIGATQKILTGAGVATATAIFGFVFIAVTFGTTPPANALPSFARQTGQPCGTCHTDFPYLTPYGRLFKLSLIHISEPTRRTPISYAVFCLKKKKNTIK